MRFRSKYEKSGGTQLECLQTEYDSMYDYITQGAIIRSRATWYEFGERNNKYFFESGKLPIKEKHLAESLQQGRKINYIP